MKTYERISKHKLELLIVRQHMLDTLDSCGEDSILREKVMCQVDYLIGKLNEVIDEFDEVISDTIEAEIGGGN